ncbi:unnamed protein product [Rotaria sp. Silwood2]|nr:unnamed protein product [Rotaria sp. Silwood2]
MGNSHSLLTPRYCAHICTNDGKIFKLSYRALVDHIVLLRLVTAHPEITEPGETLNYFIEDYCRRMVHQEMNTRHQQQALPWQIEWIWHVHRLHPVAYNDDCTKQLSSRQVVDKKYRRVRIKEHERHHSTVFPEPIRNRATLVPSLDLVSAVIRQRDFLQKFQRHYLFSRNLIDVKRDWFEQMAQNYISFLKLAIQGEIIVPTFDIDLMWHTHMRFPSCYQRISIKLCGFVLDHNDSINNVTLADAYQKTADRWRQTYKVNYGENIPKDKLRDSQYVSSCAIIVAPSGTSGDGCSDAGDGGSGGGSCGGEGSGCGGDGGGGGEGSGCGGEGSGCGGDGGGGGGDDGGGGGGGDGGGGDGGDGGGCGGCGGCGGD